MKIDKNKIEEHLRGMVFHMVGDAADSMQRECYVVGGYVRDIFLNRPSKDIDFVTVGIGKTGGGEVGQTHASGSVP